MNGLKKQIMWILYVYRVQQLLQQSTIQVLDSAT